MDGFTDQLGVVAEFSIGLAGFTGIIAALTKDANEVVRFRFQNLLASSFAPGFFALFVIGSNYTHIPQDVAVMVASALFALYILCFAGFAIRRSRHLPFGGNGGLSLPILRFFQFTATTVLVLQVLGLVFMQDQIYGLFFYGLVILLFQGAVSFMALALSILGGIGE